MSLRHGEHMNKINYQRELEKLLDRIEDDRARNPHFPVPRLLLHSCCAPCSSYCIEYLSEYFDITVFYYNPNLYPDQEYEKRVLEQKRFIAEFNDNVGKNVSVIEGDFEKSLYYETVRGLEDEPERGIRCSECFKLRLGKTAQTAADGNFDYFATTLTISPQKNAKLLNKIGEEASGKYGVRYLATDFKKKEGYKRSIELSNEYGMYRQDYCGCEFSFRDRRKNKPFN